MRDRTSERRVLLVDLDDLGHELFAAAIAAGKIPKLAGYKAAGCWFPRFWAASICSTFRARVLTGLDSYRPGNEVLWNVYDTLSFTGPTAPWICEGLPGLSAKFGKWHLCGAGHLATVAGPGGYGTFIGSLNNLPSYTAWMKFDSAAGAATPESGNATNVIASAALDAVENDVDFVHASFHCVHTPLHLPPDGDPPGATYSGTTPQAKKYEMLRHLDYHLGRLVDAALARDYVVLIACDNGTDTPGAKGTMSEAGICTPLIVVGDGVTQRTSRRLVQATDLWATVRELRGASGAAADSFSFADEFGMWTGTAERAYITCDDCTNHVGEPPTPSAWRRAIRSKRWKLIDAPAGEEFYDLDADPTEATNLLAGALTSEQLAAYADLVAHLPVLS